MPRMFDLAIIQKVLRGHSQDQAWSLWSVAKEEARYQWPLWHHKELNTLILQCGLRKRNQGRTFPLTLLMQKSLKALVVSTRQGKVNLVLTSRPSATSWLTGTTCSSRLPSRPTSRYAPKHCRIIFCLTGFQFVLFSLKLNSGTLLSLQLSGTEILDTIDSEATGTLKDCYVTLGGCLPD